jgi:hypothetical protein
MKKYYHLPHHLIYESFKSNFIDIDFDYAVKYLKLIYEDFEKFETEFLSKIQHITELNSLKNNLIIKFKATILLEETELIELDNISFKIEAKSYLNKRSNKSKIYDKYISKIQAFLQADDNSEQSAKIDDQFSSVYINNHSTPSEINVLNEYTITENKEKINFKITQVEKLIVKSAVKLLNCSQIGLKEIEVNQELLFLNVSGNELQNIKLNKSLMHLEIAGNKLKTIKCNHKLKELFVTNNNLNTINLNHDLSVLICNGNRLKKITLNEKLEELYCIGNQIEQLVLNENLIKLQAQKNPLKIIKLNKKIKSIEISHPENNEIIFDNSIQNGQVEIHYYFN